MSDEKDKQVCYVFGETIRGASHIRENKPNQDAILWKQNEGIGLPLVLAVADGHGSDKYFRSDKGAEIAVKVAVEELYNFALQLSSQITDFTLIKHLAERLPKDIVEKWKAAVVEHLRQNNFSEDEWKRLRFTDEELKQQLKIENGAAVHAITLNLTLPYGSTLLTALVTELFILYLQLGDGDIVKVIESGQAFKPLPRDKRLVANETFSLCQPTAPQLFKTQLEILKGPMPALIMLSTDGYSNSFNSEEGFLKVGSDILRMLRTDGLGKVQSSMPEWLTETSEKGSGDDISLGLICHTNTLQASETLSLETSTNISENDDKIFTSSSPELEIALVARQIEEDAKEANAVLLPIVDKIPDPREDVTFQSEQASVIDGKISEEAISSGPEGTYVNNTTSRTFACHMTLADHSKCLSGFFSEPPKSGDVPLQPTGKHGEGKTAAIKLNEPPSGVAPQQHILTVSLEPGKGDYNTITEALKHARSSMVITVHPGTYRESLVLTQDIKIVAAESQDPVIIESKAPCLRIQAEHAAVQGLTFRGKLGITAFVAKEKAAVEIRAGQSRLTDCQITSQTQICVRVCGAAADPILERCVIHNSEGKGIIFTDYAQGWLENSYIYQNKDAGLVIMAGSNPIIRCCDINNGKGKGILVWQNAAGRIEQCKIMENQSVGIEIRKGSDPVIQGCLIANGRSNAIMLLERSRGRLIDCSITENEGIGVVILGASTPQISGCKLRGGKSEGILIDEQGGGFIENCDIEGHTSVGILIRQQGNPQVQQCQIYNGRSAGVQVEQQGAGMLKGCNIFQNGGDGVLVKAGSSLTLEKSDINKNEGDGVVVKGGSSVVILEGQIHHYGGETAHALLFVNRSRGLVERCKIKAHECIGIQASQRVKLHLRSDVIRSETYCLIVSHESIAVIENPNLRTSASHKPITCDGGSQVRFVEH